ncbi:MULTISPECIES: hypothetical protein [unclassified Pseudofrankia]|uniref:hypothetical protein n=1 Tax=unclassified Pseudofrankia TaxID=2994372 RepID=UPI0008DA6405|nr:MULTISPECIES: hypothetical protein [unclassified Pseudofrankia]MDT3444881.1 hypothetical protein [Pseudofrankia sp. BMG5.37]OHV74202.1 hypothetical protein BCD48_32485 [Pseudofrankia sp. BMG5.36]
MTSVSVRSSPAGSGARAAAERAAARSAVWIDLPGHRQVALPSLDQLAFLGGVAALAVLEIIEWPVAVILVVGHTLATSRHSKALRDFGEALEEA